jgi:hypothetical protein
MDNKECEPYLGMVVHTYKSNYEGGRVGDHGLGKVRMRPYLKSKLKTKGLGEWLKW